MTGKKALNLLRGERTPAYVGRETGAAELQISADTWDQWVKEGRLPPPCSSFPPGTPRWRWKDVDERLSGREDAPRPSSALAGARNFGHKGEGRRRQ